MITVSLWYRGRLVGGLDVASQDRCAEAVWRLAKAFPSYCRDGAHIDITDQESAEAKAALKH